MTTVQKLRIAAGAGDPNPVLCHRIDVVQAALKWYEAYTDVNSEGRWGTLATAEDKLERAVRRYNISLKKRLSSNG